MLLLPALAAAGCLVIVVSGPGNGPLDAGIQSVTLPDGGEGYRLPDGGITTSLVESICHVNPLSGTPGAIFTYDGQDSEGSPGASVVAWSWSFGDGTIGQGATTSHTYADAGTYTASLTATDDTGASGTANCPSITVTP